MRTITFFTAFLAAAVLFAGCSDDKGGSENLYTVTIGDDGHGTAVADMAEAAEGAAVKITATADDGYIFSKWTVVSGEVVLSGETENPATFTMPDGNVQINAEFAEGTGVVSATAVARFATEWNEAMDADAQAEVIKAWSDDGTATGTIYLHADIDMSGVDFEPIGTYTSGFTGTFDGQGHTISNLTISKEGTNGVGLFGALASGASVTGINLDKCNIQSTGQYVGGIAGNITNATISECTVSNGIISGGTFYIGGIAGYSGGSTISDCTVSLSEISNTGTSGTSVGGIAGLANTATVDGVAVQTKILDCNIEMGTISSIGGSAGGIVGQPSGGFAPYISGCTVDGTVIRAGSETSTANYAGGIIGYSEGNAFYSITSLIEGCTVKNATISANNSAGGIVGRNYTLSTIAGCIVTASTITSGNLRVGGISGDNWTLASSTIIGCVSAPTTMSSGTSTYDGIITGNNRAVLNTCYWAPTGTITQIATDGLVGSSIITNCVEFDVANVSSSTNYFNSGSPTPIAAMNTALEAGGYSVRWTAGNATSKWYPVPSVTR